MYFTFRTLSTLALLLLMQGYARSKDKPASNNLQFVTNKGQITDQYGQVRKDIDASCVSGGLMMFIGDGAIHYQWIADTGQHKQQPADEFFEHTTSVQPTPVNTYRMDVELVGADKNAAMIPEAPTGYKEHYYTSRTGEGGVHTAGYRKLTYKNVWPGIDWVLYIPETGKKAINKGVKYDFVVHEGADPADIRIRYKGTTSLALKEGALIAGTPYGTIEEAAPYSYSAATGAEVKSKYILQGNELRFEVGEYTGSLIIDPRLLWGTYFGGSLNEMMGNSIACDKYGGIYFTGTTASTTNIATTGAHQTTLIAAEEAYLVKFNRDGQRIWATYYGGTKGEHGFSCAVDFNTDIIVLIHAASDSLATTGAYQTSLKGIQDHLLVKFDSSGQRIWATYHGGESYEFLGDVACDEAGNIYIGGETQSSTGISTTGAFQNSYAGKQDGYIAKFNSNGQKLWGTYYGGGELERIQSISISKNALYFTGYTNTRTGLASTGAYKTSGATNYRSVLIGKFNLNGQRIWATYYGGVGTDTGIDIAVDTNDNIYVTGRTNSDTGIATTGAHQTTGIGTQDAFIIKFNTNGQLQWGTYLGASSYDYANSICIGIKQDIFVSGQSLAAGLATLNGYRLGVLGSRDNFWVQFSPGGTQKYGTYYGGTGYEGMNSWDPIAYSYEGRLYFASTTTSNNNIATTGSYQTTYSGNDDAYLTAWAPDTIAYIPLPYTDTVWCPGDTLKVPYEVNNPFKAGNSFTVQLSDANGSFASPVDIGSRTDTLGDTIYCLLPVNTPTGNGYRLRIVADSPGYISLDNQADIRIAAAPGSFTAGSNSPVCEEDSLQLYSSSLNGVTWRWTGPDTFAAASRDTFIARSSLADTGNYILEATLISSGCTLYDTTTVVIKPLPDKPVAGSNSPVCTEDSLHLTISSSTAGVSYTWEGPNNFSSNSATPYISNMQSGNAGDYTGAAILNGCSRKDTITVTVKPKPATPTAGAPNSPLCAKQDLQLSAGTIPNAKYTWYGANGFTDTIQNPTRPNTGFNDSGYYYVYATVNSCLSDTDSVHVVVNTDPFVNIFPTPGATICAGATATFTAIPTNGGTATYDWHVNGSSTGSTGVAYPTNNLNNGDKVTVLMTSTGTCATPFVDTSNEIVMTVTPLLAPSVAISANPNTSLFPNEPVTFTATPIDAGNTPGYQWQRNGQDINGATNAVWGANANYMSDGDEICVVLTSSYSCPDPDTAKSNCIKVDIRLSVEDITNSNDIDVYPNPVRSMLHIDGIAEDAKISLYDVTGRNVAAQVLITNGNATVDMHSVAAGSYVLRVDSPEGKPYYVKVVKE